MTIEKLQNLSKRYASNIELFKILDSKMLTQNLVLVKKSFYKKPYIKSRELVTFEDYQKRRVVPKSRELQSLIDEFLSVMKTKVNSSTYSQIEDKIERINIEYVDKLDAYGSSNSEEWTIRLPKNFDKHTLFHELLHQVSSIVEKKGMGKRVFVGLETQDIPYGTITPTRMGLALNEGLTEHLVEKYFNIPHEGSYAFEKNICKILELIVGEEKLKECYLNNDMVSLQNRCLTLIQNDNPDIFMNFIRSMDFIYYNQKSNKNGKYKKYVLDETCKEIGVFLSRMFINSLLEESNKLRSMGKTDQEIYKFQQEKIQKFTMLMQNKKCGLSLDISGTINLLNQTKENKKMN